MVDKVKPLKLESSDTGGTQNDEYPTSLNPQQDFVELAGIVIDDATHADESTQIWRADLDMMFMDGNNPSGYTLTQLAATATHEALRQLIHFIDEQGPANGFASGAYRETLPSANPFPTSETWWESAAKLKKIVDETVTYNGNKTVATDQWRMYDVDGSTVIATVLDTIAYTGVVETSRTRTIS